MTTLAAAGLIATSSLASTQVQLSIAANNVANADTEGYTRKTASSVALTTAGTGSGVTVGKITSGVSRILLADLVAATTAAGEAGVTADYLDRLQSLMGSTSSSSGNGTSLANSLAAVEEAFAALADTPESVSLAATAVNELDELAAQLRALSASVQSLRSAADTDIAAAVTSANDTITAIASLNEQILATAARGQSTADLEDQRNQALATLSQSLGVTSFIADDGSMKVYTTTGQVLVDSRAHLLSFDPSSSVGAGVVYDGSGSGLSGITVDGKDITASMTEGEIGALLALRDSTLPEVQEMLDALASTLVSSLNAVSPDLLSGTDATDITVNGDLLRTPSALLPETGGADIATALVEALQGKTAFPDTARQGGGESTFADYAARLLSLVVSDANSASAHLERATAQLAEISDTMSSLYGVNIDEETARMSNLEQLYSASAQVLSILKQMYEDLLAAIA
ncbi:flagellar hook-associated protein FlgK [Polymorphum gilvum]|uniref:Flagellar hook-associated protein 1 n=1 Tax=Polymorphum gilvum (strain LMG 25793 / CGMCC 1.9160 / SL003B-26A1) TaxID=991905 RepID=F2J5K6_POLGS|nr:flagellar hook-associated protein FlgK [Polymorphum gilvum]ADZ72376.1 Flagellar hook-associated protein [Polymorphum gilvum SL003B-26A1]